MNQNLLRPHIAALTVNVLYGFNFVIAKDVMPEYIGPSGFILLRATGGLILFWAIWLLRKREAIQTKDLVIFAACGLFGVAINQLLFFIGLNLSTPVNGAIIMTTNPIMVLLMAAIFIKEKITPTKGLGIMMGAAGAILLILYSRGSADFSSDTWKGNLLIFINAISFAIYMVISKPLMKKYHPLTVITYTFTFGWLFVIPFGYQEFMEIQWSSFPAHIIWKVAYVILGVTFIAYLFNVYALKYLNASAVSFYIYVQPVVAALHAVLLGKDTISWMMIFCSLMIFFGVFLIGRKKKKDPLLHPETLGP